MMIKSFMVEIILKQKDAMKNVNSKIENYDMFTFLRENILCKIFI